MSVKEKYQPQGAKSDTTNTARSGVGEILSMEFKISPFTASQGKHIEKMIEAGRSFNPQSIIGGPGRSRK